MMEGGALQNNGTESKVEDREILLAEGQVGDATTSTSRRQPARRSPQASRVPVTPTSGLAISSFALGIGGLTVLPLVGSILAIVFGYLARNDIRQRRGELAGDGLAVAGLVMGWVAVGAALVICTLALLGVTTSLCCVGPCGLLSLAAD